MRITATAFSSTSLVGSFTQTLGNQWPPNYYINMISFNILPLVSFFSQHRPLDTPSYPLHYTLPPQSKYLKQNKPIWEEPLWNRHHSVTDTILRSRWCPQQRGSLYSCVVIILTGLCNSAFSTYQLYVSYKIFWKTSCRLSVFSVFSAYFVFWIRYHNIWAIAVYVGDKYSVILFSLNVSRELFSFFKKIHLRWKMWTDTKWKSIKIIIMI